MKLGLRVPTVLVNDWRYALGLLALVAVRLYTISVAPSWASTLIVNAFDSPSPKLKDVLGDPEVKVQEFVACCNVIVDVIVDV